MILLAGFLCSNAQGLFQRGQGAGQGVAVLGCQAGKDVSLTLKPGRRKLVEGGLARWRQGQNL